MNSRERVLKALNHEETDRIPLDLGSSNVTGIARNAYLNLLCSLCLCGEFFQCLARKGL